MSDEQTTQPGDNALIAAEYVLGVLDAAERRAVLARIAREPALRAEVEYWEQRLGGLAAEIKSIDPPPHVWANVEAALSPPATHGRVWESLVFWRWAALGSAAIAAASLAGLLYLARAPAPNAPLVAKLDASGGQAGFVATIDSGGAGLTIVPASVSNLNQRVLELWLIAPGDQPRSLGLIEPGRPIRINVPADLRQRVAAQATLAVSVEPLGGSPTGLPTGPVVASGKLTKL
jgi:anti-sigma-K factor RskA